MHEDPPEPTEEEIASFETEQAVKRAPEITITGLTAEAVQVVVEAAVERNYRLQERVGEAVDKAVKKAITNGVDEGMQRLMEEQLRPAIAEVIANGWQKTDHYGQPQGPKQSLAQRITEFLFEKDRYNGNGTTIDKVFKEELEKALKTEAGKAFADALASFKGKVDTEINGRIMTAVRSAMGLK
jgi:hypothetical protein